MVYEILPTMWSYSAKNKTCYANWSKTIGTSNNKFHSKLLRVRRCGVYQTKDIANIDQTPLRFVLDDGKTYADKGSSQVWCISGSSGFNNWQCSVQLTIFADGVWVCVCLYSSTVKTSSVCKMSKTYLRVQINDLVFWILIDCVMPSSIIAVSENVIFHLQRRKLQPLSYWRENDMI